jgi:hypothetical protein
MHMNVRAPISMEASPISFWKCGVAPDAMVNLDDLVSRGD